MIRSSRHLKNSISIMNHSQTSLTSHASRLAKLSKLTLTRRALRRFGTMSSLDQDDDLDELQMTTATGGSGGDDDGPGTGGTTTTNSSLDIESPPPSGLRAWTLRASSYVVSKMLQPPAPPERTEFSLDPSSNGDEEGTTSGGTSGDDIWGTPTSGGPDDESFAGSPVSDRVSSIFFLTVSFFGLSVPGSGSCGFCWLFDVYDTLRARVRKLFRFEGTSFTLSSSRFPAI